MKTIAFLLGLFSLNILYAQKINLQLKLKEGETYSQVQTSKLIIDQTINGQNVETEMTINGKTSYHVNELKGSVYSMDISFDSLSLEMKSAQGSVQFSSESENPEIMGRVLKALIHQPISARMTWHGKFLEVRSNTIIEKVVNQFQELNEAQRTQIKQQLEQAWGEEPFKASFEMLSAVYPNENVKVGDKWPISSQLKSTVLLNVDAVYTFTKSSGEGNAIHGDIKLLPADSSVTAVINGMPIVYNLSGTISSDIVLDKQTSWISKANLNQTISGTATIKDNEQVPGGLVIPMTLKTQTILSEK